MAAAAAIATMRAAAVLGIIVFMAQTAHNGMLRRRSGAWFSAGIVSRFRRHYLHWRCLSALFARAPSNSSSSGVAPTGSLNADSGVAPVSHQQATKISCLVGVRRKERVARAWWRGGMVRMMGRAATDVNIAWAMTWC